MKLADAPTISMTREEARLALATHLAAVRANPAAHPWEKEDEAIVLAYRALAKGRKIIDLRETITAGGVHEENGLPKLAVCRADGKHCWVEVQNEGSVFFSHIQANMRTWGRNAAFLNRVSLPADTLARPRTSARGMTLVPMVPAALRPPHNLAGYLTLWEVEQWTPMPPGDPFLLKWLGTGFLCAVIAMWNLTPLERAAMRASLVR